MGHIVSPMISTFSDCGKLKRAFRVLHLVRFGLHEMGKAMKYAIVPHVSSSQVHFVEDRMVTDDVL